MRDEWRKEKKSLEKERRDQMGILVKKGEFGMWELGWKSESRRKRE